MKRIVMAMLCLGLVGSVEAGGKITFPLAKSEVIRFCNAFGTLVGRYQGYIAAGESKSSAATHFSLFFQNVERSAATTLLEGYFAITGAIGMKDGEFPAAHRLVAEAICLEFNRNMHLMAQTILHEREKCRKKTDAFGSDDGWDM